MRRLITGTVLFFFVLTAGSVLKIEPAVCRKRLHPEGSGTPHQAKGEDGRDG